MELNSPNLVAINLQNKELFIDRSGSNPTKRIKPIGEGTKFRRKGVCHEKFCLAVCCLHAFWFHGVCTASSGAIEPDAA
jgi:hypothetical protein